MSTKRTKQISNKTRSRKHGFRNTSAKVKNNRRAKGRKKLAPQTTKKNKKKKKSN